MKTFLHLTQVRFELSPIYFAKNCRKIVERPEHKIHGHFLLKPQWYSDINKFVYIYNH